MTFTATASSCATPNYRFWIAPPGRAWAIVQNYSPSDSYVWGGTGLAGTYRVEVDVRNASSTAAYDAVANTTYQLLPCTSVAISLGDPGPDGIMSIEAFTKTACPGVPTFRFWLRPPGGAWRIAQDWKASDPALGYLVYNWQTSGVPRGTWGIEADVRNQGSTAPYEATSAINYLLAPSCTSVKLTWTPSPPAGTMSPVTLSGYADGCHYPEYRFWIRPSGGSWKIVMDWAPANGYDHRSYQWLASTAGTYHVEVDAREQGETVAYDAVAIGTYDIVGCSSAQISANVASPQLPGTPIRITGSATCPTAYPEFRFWIRDLQGRWAIAQDYAGYANQPYFYFDWNTTGLAQGTYGLEVDVRDAGAASPYEAVANMTFQLGTPNCATPTLAPNPGTGPIVVFTASTSGCITPPNYRFWISPPSGSWTIVQDYSSTNTFSWNTTGKSGTYRIEVDVRNAGSSLPYVAVKLITYTVGRCAAAQLTTDKTSPQAPGVTVLLTATASCTSTPEYEFLLTINGVTTALRGYGPTNTFSWDTTGLAGGTYVLEVWVRTQGALWPYDTSADTWLALRVPTCEGAQLSSDKPSPQPVGTAITLTGSATCPTGAPEYRFSLIDANNQVTVLQDWSTNDTFAWDTSGLRPGTYQLVVEVRTLGSTGGSETGMQIPFVLS